MGNKPIDFVMEKIVTIVKKTLKTEKDVRFVGVLLGEDASFIALGRYKTFFGAIDHAFDYALELSEKKDTDGYSDEPIILLNKGIIFSIEPFKPKNA